MSNLRFELLTEVPDGGFRCQDCDRQFSQLSTMVEHKRQCARIQQAQVVVLEKHEILHNAELSWSCDFCCKCFCKESSLLEHLKTHTGERPFQCAICARAFAQKSNVKKHVKTHKVWPKPVRKATSDKISEPSGVLAKDLCIYECNYCDVTSDTLNEFKKHISAHEDEKVFKCTNTSCDKFFKDIKILVRHVEECGQSYKCQFCNKAYDNLKAMKLHQIAHEVRKDTGRVVPKQRFQCSKCQRSFGSQKGLHNHSLQKCDSRKLCTICDMTFSTEKSLKQHVQKQHQDLNDEIQCLICQKKLRSKFYLKSHMLIHTGNLPFKCETCGVEFNRKDKLKRHSLIHGEKQFKCPFAEATGCSKAFARKDKLKEHLMEHHGSDNFHCDMCGEKFVKSNDLKFHQKVVHAMDTKDLKCFKCNKKFKQEKLRQKHHARVHGIIHIISANLSEENFILS